MFLNLEMKWGHIVKAIFFFLPTIHPTIQRQFYLFFNITLIVYWDLRKRFSSMCDRERGGWGNHHIKRSLPCPRRCTSFWNSPVTLRKPTHIKLQTSNILLPFRYKDLDKCSLLPMQPLTPETNYILSIAKTWDANFFLICVPTSW